MRRTGVLIVALACALIATSPAAARARHWHSYSVPAARSFAAVRCPSDALCVALTRAGAIWTTRNADAVRPVWTETTGLKGMGPAEDYEQRVAYNLSCPSTTLCITTDGSKIVTTTDPTGPGSAWKAVDLAPRLDLEGRIDAISCPKTTLCVAAINESGKEEGDGTSLAFATATDPGGDASAWTVTKTDVSDFLTMLACSPSGMCAGGNEYNDIVATPNALDPSKWASHLAGLKAELAYLTCPSATLCVGSDDRGRLLRSTAPTRKGSWKESPLPAGAYLGAVSCSSPSSCTATGGNRRTSTAVLTSASPLSVSGWRQTTFPGHGRSALNSITCRPGGFCIAVGDGGLIATRR